MFRPRTVCLFSDKFHLNVRTNIWMEKGKPTHERSRFFKKSVTRNSKQTAVGISFEKYVAT